MCCCCCLEISAFSESLSSGYVVVHPVRWSKCYCLSDGILSLGKCCPSVHCLVFQASCPQLITKGWSKIVHDGGAECIYIPNQSLTSVVASVSQQGVVHRGRMTLVELSEYFTSRKTCFIFRLPKCRSASLVSSFHFPIWSMIIRHSSQALSNNQNEGWLFQKASLNPLSHGFVLFSFYSCLYRWGKVTGVYLIESQRNFKFLLEEGPFLQNPKNLTSSAPHK